MKFLALVLLWVPSIAIASSSSLSIEQQQQQQVEGVAEPNHDDDLCCLCGEGEDCLVPEANEGILLELEGSDADGAQMVATCAMLQLDLLDNMNGQCASSRAAYASTCCAAAGTSFSSTAEEGVSSDVALMSANIIEDESLFTRITRHLTWAVKSNGGTSYSAPKTYYPPATSRYVAPASTRSYYTAPATSYNSGGGGGCTICRNGQYPRASTKQGIVIGFTDAATGRQYSYTGTCGGCNSYLQANVAKTHRLCPATQASFDSTCGCQASSVVSNANPMGSWNW
jgi:hypothetical protein